jgi:probable HAF family extracellular repeat protein
MKYSFAFIMLSLLPVQPLYAGDKAGNCVAQHYDAIVLPLRPSHINDSGQVAGTTSGHRAGLWSKQEGLHELPLPAGFYNSEGVGLNNSGHMTGVAYDRGFMKHQAFMFANGSLTLLSSEQSVPHWISDSDEIAGEAMVPQKNMTGPVLWTKESATPLGGCCGGTAMGVNSRRQVVGDIYDKDGQYHAFLWDTARGIQSIGPSDRYSSAIALNDEGHVLIQAFSESYLYSEGKLRQLDLSPGYPRQPRAFNNCDVVVGSFGPFADANHAFVWESSQGFRDLNDLIAPASGWKLKAATSINNNGEIVGWGDYKDSENTGFLLVPGR